MRLCFLAAGDVDLVARDAGLTDGFADFGLVAVDLAGVDVSVSGLEGGQAGLDGLFGWGVPDAETC